MTAAAIITWMGAVQALMEAAPDVIRFAGTVKNWIDDLFRAGMITAARQNELHARVTEICRATLTGTLPAHWQVEDDPK